MPSDPGPAGSRNNSAINRLAQPARYHKYDDTAVNVLERCFDHCEGEDEPVEGSRTMASKRPSVFHEAPVAVKPVDKGLGRVTSCSALTSLVSAERAPTLAAAASRVVAFAGGVKAGRQS